MITDKFSTFVNPDVPIPFDIEKLTSINDAMVLPYPKIDVILPQFLEFVGDAVLVAHNAGFDVIDAIADKYGIELNLRKGKAFCGTGYIEGQKVMLAKPQTYMNLSGDSVSAW